MHEYEFEEDVQPYFQEKSLVAQVFVHSCLCLDIQFLILATVKLHPDHSLISPVRHRIQSLLTVRLRCAQLMNA